MTEDADADLARFEAWNARLDEAVARVDSSGLAPFGYRALIGARFGGPDPLDFVQTVRRDDPVPHWLYVTRGFSEPMDFDDSGGAGGTSGFGFELTLRVLRDPADASPDADPDVVGLLQSFARYVFQTGNAFADGDYSALETPRPSLPGTAGFGFVRDAELDEITTPLGRIAFRSVVPVTADELAAITTWSTYGFLDLAVASGKLGPTRIAVPNRASWLADPAFAAGVREGGARDGSRTGHLFFLELAVRVKPRLLRTPAFTVALDRLSFPQFLAVLPNRIRFEKMLTLIGPNGRVVFEPAAAPSVSGDASELRVGLTPPAVDALVRSFEAGAVRYDVPGVPLTLELA